MGFKWEHRFELFDSLGETQLFHLARNEAAPVENRLFAVEMLLKKGYQSAKHVDLRGLVVEVEKANGPIEGPITPESTAIEADFGAPSASVTTKTLSEPVLKMDKRKKITPANEAPTSDTTPDTEKD